jgi:Family of unknown function (DUF6356)
MLLTRAFTEHPASVGETYFEHMGNALCFAVRMLFGGLACLVHAVFPFLCVRTGSSCIEALHDRMVVHRVRRRNGESRLAIE